jgi:hypothetical protein
MSARCPPQWKSLCAKTRVSSKEEGFASRKSAHFSPVSGKPMATSRHMKLNDTQKAQVTQWIDQGAKLAEIQTRLADELGLTLTYMEVRFLVDDLKLVPKDPEKPKLADPALPGQPTTPPKPALTGDATVTPNMPSRTGHVSVSVDHLARPGTLVSGTVNFSDGNAADWSLDQAGRLGLAPRQKAYRPSASDIESFQIALQGELTKMGY